MSKELKTLKEKYLVLLNGTNTPLSMEELLLFENIEKELKVLEIIKNKEVSVAMFVDMYGYGNSCKNDKERLELYNENIGYYKQHRLLTQEEWDLLRNVLL